MQEQKKKKLKPKQDAKNQPAKGKVSTTEVLGLFLVCCLFVVSFFGGYFSFLSDKNVLEPQLENRHTHLCVLSAFPVTLVPAEGLRHYLKEGLA